VTSTAAPPGPGATSAEPKDPDQILRRGKVLLRRMTEANRPKSLRDSLKEGLIEKSEIYEVRSELEYLKGNDGIHQAEASKILDGITKAENDGEKAMQAALAKAVADDSDSRTSYAKEIERSFLQAGYDVSVAVSGPKATILRLRYVLFSRPLVYKLTTDSYGKETGLLDTCRKLGFQKIIFTDGYEKTWSYSLKELKAGR
jgi:hypothetical protein